MSSGIITLTKCDANLVGISIGGGAPLCPHVYIVQVFDNTPAAIDQTLESGDRIVAVNNFDVNGRTKLEVARMIQNAGKSVNIKYEKLLCDVQGNKTLDILVKKLKHQMVESMSSSTADALGLSRAILCNDSLVKKLEELERTEFMYNGLIDHTRRMLRAYFDVFLVYKDLGDTLCAIGVKESAAANEAFTKFGDYHRQMEKVGIHMLKKTKRVLEDLETYLKKAIPDTKLTIKKYADVKFEYLSFCLKVKEMDDEEVSYASIGEPLYRVEAGNIEYRLVLKCRSKARKQFAALRSDVLVKLELLDNKHFQDMVFQLKRLLDGLAKFHIHSQDIVSQEKLFPIECDFAPSLEEATNGPEETGFD